MFAILHTNNTLLHLGYRQAKPVSTGIVFTDEPVEDHPAPLRWHCYCQIAEHTQSFPNAARGCDPDTGLPPSFAKKQTAKHYAAKCAVEWLVTQGLMPLKLAGEIPGAAALRAGAASSSKTTSTTASRPLSISSNSSSPEAKRQKMTTSEMDQLSSMIKMEQGLGRSTTTTTDDTDMAGASSSTTEMKRQSLPDTPATAHTPQQHQEQKSRMNPLSSSPQNSSASNSSGGTPVVAPSELGTSPPTNTKTHPKVPSEAEEGEGNENGGRRLTAQVADLCKALGLGAPRYEVTADPERPGYFSGHPVFHSMLEAGHFPHGTGYVENVIGKNNAKEEIAKRVLVVLRRIKHERDMIKREIMADLVPAVDCTNE